MHKARCNLIKKNINFSANIYLLYEILIQYIFINLLHLYIKEKNINNSYNRCVLTNYKRIIIHIFCFPRKQFDNLINNNIKKSKTIIINYYWLPLMVLLTHE